jgi:serine protease Do
VSRLSDDQRSELNVPEGTDGLVITGVDETSEAFEKGLRAGDIITEAGQQKLSTIAELEDRISEAKEAGRKSLLLLVRRAGEPRFVALNLAE